MKNPIIYPGILSIIYHNLFDKLNCFKQNTNLAVVLYKTVIHNAGIVKKYLLYQTTLIPAITYFSTLMKL